MVQPFDNEGGQGMVEYLLIVSLVVLTIAGPVRCLDAPADEFVLNVSAIEIYRQ